MLKSIHTWIEKFLLSPVYFILFGIYPVFRLYVHNVHGVLVTDLFRPLVISLFFAILFFAGMKLITRDSQRSALLVFLIYFSFFNYSDARNLLINSRVAF